MQGKRQLVWWLRSKLKYEENGTGLLAHVRASCSVDMDGEWGLKVVLIQW